MSELNEWGNASEPSIRVRGTDKSNTWIASNGGIEPLWQTSKQIRRWLAVLVKQQGPPATTRKQALDTLIQRRRDP